MDQSAGVVVAVLGVSFLFAAVALRPPLGALVSGSLAPSLRDGAGLLVLALIGTTVVPYAHRRAHHLRALAWGYEVARKD